MRLATVLNCVSAEMSPLMEAVDLEVLQHSGARRIFSGKGDEFAGCLKEWRLLRDRQTTTEDPHAEAKIATSFAMFLQLPQQWKCSQVTLAGSLASQYSQGHGSAESDRY